MSSWLAQAPSPAHVVLEVISRHLTVLLLSGTIKGNKEVQNSRKVEIRNGDVITSGELLKYCFHHI
jgi:hypothetical protein